MCLLPGDSRHIFHLLLVNAFVTDTMVVKILVYAAVAVGLAYLVLNFPRVRPLPILYDQYGLTSAASTRIQTLLPQTPSPPRPQDHKNRHKKTMALVPSTLPTIRRRSLPPTWSYPNHNSRLSPSSMGSPRKARRGIFITTAIHHGR